MKRLFCLLAIFGMLLSMPVAAQEISVFCNGEKIEFDVPPVMENDRVLVPFRKIFEAMGAAVTWQEPVATAEFNGNQIQVTLDRYVMQKNGVYIFLDVPPRLYADRTLVPVRAVAEGLGAVVEWQEDTQTVTISMPSDGIENDFSAYTDYPEVPDFVDVVNSAQLVSSAAYGGGLLYAVPDGEQALVEYDAALQQAGFVAEEKQAYTSYQKEDTVVLVGLRQNDVLLVLQQKEEDVQTVAYYEHHPQTPDFGGCFSVAASEQTSDSVTYSMLSVRLSDLDRYFALLTKEGFSCVVEEENRIYCSKQGEEFIVFYDGNQLKIQWI